MDKIRHIRHIALCSLTKRNQHPKCLMTVIIGTCTALWLTRTPLTAHLRKKVDVLGNSIEILDFFFYFSNLCRRAINNATYQI